MCGITGIYDFGKRLNNYAKIKTILKTMTYSLYHRGHDDFGLLIDSKGRFAFGHARLSIIDLSKNGHQPMSDKEKTVFISFNGEIYNFMEIKKELENEGYKFFSKCDTEVIINAYKKWGIDCIKKFNGMFAFSLYDLNQEKLYLVRDRLGIKPLYYTYFKDKSMSFDGMIFASEIKSILHFPNFEREVNMEGVSSYLSFRYTIGEETLFKNIFSLSPGFYLSIDKKGTVDKIKYWDLSVSKKKLSEKRLVEETRRLMIDSVEKRMISDVPLGSYLSGGLDSSIIVGIMSKLKKGKVKTFSIGFEEEKYNEFKYAELVAKKFKTDHHEILLSPNEYLKTVKDLIKYKDLPLAVPNEAALFILSKELKKQITVVLSGEGADEIFSGYGRLFRAPADYKKLKLIRFLPSFVVDRLFSNFKRKYGNQNFRSELDHFLYLYSYFPEKEKFFLFNDEMKLAVNNDGLIKKIFGQTFENYKQLNYYDKIPFVFEKLHLPGLLFRSDSSTMAANVEARVPFVDHRLVEFALNIPRKYKMKWNSFGSYLKSMFKTSDEISEHLDSTKSILRFAFKDMLPKEVLERKKVGFPVPLDNWFRNDFKLTARKELLGKDSKIRMFINQANLQKWIDHNYLNPNNDKQFGQKLWMIFNLEIWLREYF
ncbi:MAG: asparagine synthase (glutamine-hydrolyzing) [archaeon]